MASPLFIERFLVEPEEVPVPVSVFDDKRGYAVDEDGNPIVETVRAEQTQTVSEIRGEQPDSDPVKGAKIAVAPAWGRGCDDRPEQRPHGEIEKGDSYQVTDIELLVSASRA